MAVQRDRSRRGSHGGPVSVHVDNLRQINAAAKALGDAGKALKKELRKRLRAAVKPLGVKAKANISSYLPSGYAPILKRVFRVSTVLKLTSNPSMTIRGSAKGRHKKREVRAMDRGTLRHPVFGDREVWVAQPVMPGFWTDPMKQAGPAVRDETVQVIEEFRGRIASEVSASG